MIRQPAVAQRTRESRRRVDRRRHRRDLHLRDRCFVELVNATRGAGFSPTAAGKMIDERAAKCGVCIDCSGVAGRAAAHRGIARCNADVARDVDGRRPGVAEGRGAGPDFVDGISVSQCVLIPDTDHVSVGIESNAPVVGIRREHDLLRRMWVLEGPT